MVSDAAAEASGAGDVGAAVGAPTRIVMLGASNLARGVSIVAETARLLSPGPCEIVAALGHGRSYGLDTRVLGRWLPSILRCGLWRSLEPRPHAKTLALVTDIGNDILYGASVDTIASWVEQCFDRLAAAGARTVVTQLPISNLEKLGPRRFHFMRRVLFPRCRLTLDDVRGRALELNAKVSAAAENRKIFLVPQRSDWFGFDPIHIRIRSYAGAWGEILSSWNGEGAASPRARGSLRRWLSLRSIVPEERRILGITQRREQPARRLADGTTIAFY
jgi:hypothetical protein